MFLEDGRKPDNPEETHMDTTRTCRSTPYRQKPKLRIESQTLQLWGNNTTLCNAVPPLINHAKKEKEITDDKCIYVKIDVFDMTCIWQFNSFGRCLFIHSFYPNVESEQQCFCDLNSLSSKPSEPTLSYTTLPCGVYRCIDSCNCFCSCYLENVAIFPPGGELGKCANIKNKSKIKHVVGLPLFKLLLMQWYYAMIFTTM